MQDKFQNQKENKCIEMVIRSRLSRSGRRKKSTRLERGKWAEGRDFKDYPTMNMADFIMEKKGREVFSFIPKEYSDKEANEILSRRAMRDNSFRKEIDGILRKNPSIMNEWVQKEFKEYKKNNKEESKLVGTKAYYWDTSIHRLHNVDYDSKEYSKDLKSLDAILKHGQISEDLRTAILELKDALEKKDYDLAYEISAVKSFVTGGIDEKDEKNHFQENSDYNEQNLGRNIYSYLDALHHKVAFNLMEKNPDIIPSGAMVVSREGIRQKGAIPQTSPTLKKMHSEQKEIEEEAKKRS